MLRIAVLGTEAETRPLIASAERLAQIECVCVLRESGLEGFAAVACCGAQPDGVQAICEAAGRGPHLLVDLAALKTAAKPSEKSLDE